MSTPGGVGGLRREPHPTRLEGRPTSDLRRSQTCKNCNTERHLVHDGCRPSRIVTGLQVPTLPHLPANLRDDGNILITHTTIK